MLMTSQKLRNGTCSCCCGSSVLQAEAPRKPEALSSVRHEPCLRLRNRLVAASVVKLLRSVAAVALGRAHGASGAAELEAHVRTDARQAQHTVLRVILPLLRLIVPGARDATDAATRARGPEALGAIARPHG
ncbi:hypothetical protein PINS_up023060 [Pythium insidiosum]|nr:hypothetical protein PINS_up023060 [Pythium insidiosum]